MLFFSTGKDDNDPVAIRVRNVTLYKRAMIVVCRHHRHDAGDNSVCVAKVDGRRARRKPDGPEQDRLADRNVLDLPIPFYWVILIHLKNKK